MKRRTFILAFWSTLTVCAPGLAQANAFVRGAQPAFPTSPVPMPPSPGFKNLGTIPAAPMGHAPTGTAMPVDTGMPPDSLSTAHANATPGSVPAAPYNGTGRLPAAFPSGHYVPPPSGASPQMISGYADNMDGMAEPPHMSRAEALKDGVLVRQQDIRVRSGKTYSIMVSGVAPNQIETPFRHPEMIVTNRKLATPIVHGQNLLVSTSPAFPVGVYVTGKNPHDPMISLTLIPEKTPPKNYRLIIPGFIPSVAPVMGDAGSGYAGKMVHLMRDAALRQVPQSFRQSHKVRPLPGAGGALSWHWEFSWVGSRYRISAYSIENTLGRPVNLMETSFYEKNVVAASIYPNHHLYPGEATQVFVITQLTATHSGLGGVS